MQDIVFYAAANETLGVVRDYANSRNEYAPTLVLGVSVCLRMRLFSGSESASPYPITSFSGITSWKWRMDSDFDRDTPYKLTADSNGISVQTVTDTIDGETLSFTEFAIQISDMNTVELATWLGNEKKRSGLTGELVGYDSSGNAVFVLQIDDFTVRNRLAGLNEPTSNDQEYLTRSQTELLVQTAVSSSAVTKQDKLTSANAGTGIAIDSGGIIRNTYSLPYATSASAGGVILAAGGEVVSGENASKAVTPASLKTALSGGTAFVPREAVSSFVAITDLGTATSATLSAGKAYKLVATSGEHTLTTGTLPAQSYGLDSHIELFVGASTLVHASDPLILMDALTPNAVNNCSVKFRDGEARMYVEDHDAGYTVTLDGGTAGTGLDGTLYYGLTGSTQNYIVFSHELNGIPVDFGTAANTVSRNLVGNGPGNTILSGSLDASVPVSVSNLDINELVLSDGTLKVTNSGIPGELELSVSGATVAFMGTNVLGGTVSGVGSVLFQNGCVVSGAGTISINKILGVVFDGASVSGLTFTGFDNSSGENRFSLIAGTSDFTNCTFTGMKTTTGPLIFTIGASISVNFNSCVISGNKWSYGGLLSLGEYSTLSFTDCVITGNTAWNLILGRLGTSGNVYLTGTTISGNTISGTGLFDAWNLHVLNITNCVIDQSGKNIMRSKPTATTTVSGSTLNCNILVNETTASTAGSTLVFSGTNVFKGTIRGNGYTKFDDGAILDLRGNTNSMAISGGTINVTGYAWVIGVTGSTIRIEGKGSYIENNGGNNLD